jgi:hypothetical protein
LDHLGFGLGSDGCYYGVAVGDEEIEDVSGDVATSTFEEDSGHLANGR